MPKSRQLSDKTPTFLGQPPDRLADRSSVHTLRQSPYRRFSDAGSRCRDRAGKARTRRLRHPGRSLLERQSARRCSPVPSERTAVTRQPPAMIWSTIAIAQSMSGSSRGNRNMVSATGVGGWGERAVVFR